MEQELRVHVGVHDRRPGPSESARLQVTFLVLDWLLGEDDVERWLGQVEALETVPVGFIDGDGLLGAVQSIARSARPGRVDSVPLEDANGTAVFASFRRALRWIYHPTLDTHHGVHAAFAGQHNGLPADGAALDSLRRLEDELETLLGSRGLLTGHETASAVEPSTSTPTAKTRTLQPGCPTGPAPATSRSSPRLTPLGAGCAVHCREPNESTGDGCTRPRLPGARR